MPSVVSSLTSFVQGIFQSIWNLFAAVIGLFQNVLATVFGLIQSFVAALTHIFAGFLNGIGNLIQGAADLVGGTVSFVWGMWFYRDYSRDVDDPYGYLGNIFVLALLGGGYYLYSTRQNNSRSVNTKSS